MYGSKLSYCFLVLLDSLSLFRLLRFFFPFLSTFFSLLNFFLVILGILSFGFPYNHVAYMPAMVRAPRSLSVARSRSAFLSIYMILHPLMFRIRRFGLYHPLCMHLFPGCFALPFDGRLHFRL